MAFVAQEIAQGLAEQFVVFEQQESHGRAAGSRGKGGRGAENDTSGHRSVRPRHALCRLSQNFSRPSAWLQSNFRAAVPTAMP